MPRRRQGFFDPKVSSYLIADEGEIIIDEVRKHPVAYTKAVLQAILSLLILITAFWFDTALAWLPIIVAVLVAAVAVHQVLSNHMDRFVITNMRVFRVHGIVEQHWAMMPLARILDIAVDKPVLGRLFDYGHFVFESAAQDQGLRDIRFVGHPKERDLTIQRLIKRSGLRADMAAVQMEDDD